MKLTVYKGFNKDFLCSIDGNPLVDNDIEVKFNVSEFNSNIGRTLNRSLFSLEDNSEAWVTYEEYTLIKDNVDSAIKDYGLTLEIIVNNLFPDYYPIPFEIDQPLLEEIDKCVNTVFLSEVSERCSKFLSVYNSLVNINGVLYGSFYNYEYDRDYRNDFHISIIPYYENQIKDESSLEASDIDIFINEDVETYLRDLDRIRNLQPAIIGFKKTEGGVSERILASLKAYCVQNGIRLVRYHEQINGNDQLNQELAEIARNDIKINNFQNFRSLKFYKNPDIDKDTIEISQGTIIQEIIRQAESSYDNENGNTYRDIFITAPTGAGKSVMFQIPAVYLAKHYQKLTIIIEPVKALMQDQRDRLVRNGYTRVEAFNSDLISQVEKEAVLRKIREGNVDLLYLSPETLLSYSIQTIIGDRDIGLLIVDEAHIVTTWGMGFRPDYWYLGSYINKLRNKIQTRAGRNRRTYNFPICAFTATAINGGEDDSVNDTVISLYMENPIKYIGYVRRDDISFDIQVRERETLNQERYHERKTADMSSHINNWITNNEKTIVYFPYAQDASDAARGAGSFNGITISPRKIGVYTGRNVDGQNREAFAEERRDVFLRFRQGTMPIIYATKAFGMGIDIDDVKNVYHYAISGNLCDYVQEIGRAARRPGMQGVAITDFYTNDMSYMNRLFGMSQIKQYQIMKVLEGIYDVYKRKGCARSFLISPQSFTYIFNGKGTADESNCINKLKTCLLMLEKDFNDKFNYKVLISRPQSVFTKAFVVIRREKETDVLGSEYGQCFTFICRGRQGEQRHDNIIIYDVGDVYSLDLQQVWEKFYVDWSFPRFKFEYFKDHSNVMPSIREYIFPRQKVSIQAHNDLLLSDVVTRMYTDINYITNSLYRNFRNAYFSADDFVGLISDHFGVNQTKIIVNSLFDLVDPKQKCVIQRYSEGVLRYTLSNGILGDLMLQAVNRSNVIHLISNCNSNQFSSYIDVANDERSNVALKLLSILGYITYEIVGGSEPEIFIRLNAPKKVEDIVLRRKYYNNDYVDKAKQKHDRDVAILGKYFLGAFSDLERWDYIENYFLGYDVLGTENEVGGVNALDMTNFVDERRSYSTHNLDSWNGFNNFFDDNDMIIINKIASMGIPVPEYLSTILKKMDESSTILMSWPSKNTLICQQDTLASSLEFFKQKGWKAYRFNEIDYDELKERLK